MAKHPPAHHREVLRALRDGVHPLDLVEEATSIADAGHAAGALAALAADARVPVDKAADLARAAVSRLRRLDRPGRVGEAWRPVLERLGGRGGKGWARELAACQDAAATAVTAMPDGTWAQDALTALAPVIGPAGRAALMRRALANRGLEVEGAKAVLRAAPSNESDALWAIASDAPPEVTARLAAYRTAHGHGVDDALREAWAVPDTAARHEALRVLAWNTEDADELARLARSAEGKDAADAVHVLTTVGAREDRLGIGEPAKRFWRAAAVLPRLDGKARAKAERKLRQAMERAGVETSVLDDGGKEATPQGAPASSGGPPRNTHAPGAPAVPGPPVAAGPRAPDGDVPSPPAPDGPQGEREEGVREEAARGIPAASVPRHVLALVDGYRSMGPPQVRAVARAAPLCAAFGLDLALVGFPMDAAALVDLVERDSAVGEHAGHARRLLDEGRIHEVPLRHGVPEAWPGHPLATTPHPQDGKATALEDVPAPVCLLVGLGPHGLPKRMLNAVARHHELTGQGISLETATAMGILADRLGRLPRP